MRLLYIISAALLFTGCVKDELKINELFTDKNNDGLDTPNELIIYYDEDTSESDRIAMRAQYGVDEYQQCQCADPNLELWIFDLGGAANGAGIEGVKETADADERIEDTDFNSKFSLSVYHDNIVSVPDIDIESISGLTVNSNSGPTIAILDSGVEFNYEGFTQPYLYDASNMLCNQPENKVAVGWNFVNNNALPYDDHYGKHGTINTHLIASRLVENQIPFQILPVKVADNEGKVKYFDLLCGFQYAAGNPDIDIINMSLGWYDFELPLLETFITNVQNEVLVICSAGNDNSNNDADPHYPSSYDLSNIVSVASTANESLISPDLVEFARFSNYGSYSVDIAALGEDILFEYDNEVYETQGTSYSTAITTAFAASLYNESYDAQTLKSVLYQNCINSSNLVLSSESSYVPF